MLTKRAAGIALTMMAMSFLIIAMVSGPLHIEWFTP